MLLNLLVPIIPFNLVYTPPTEACFFTLQTDLGGEFHPLAHFLVDCDINHKIVCPHTHHQNGVVERKQTHVVELGLTFSHHASLPLKFWNFVFLTFVYLINKFPKASLNFSIPYHVFFMLSHDYNFLKTFGYSCLFFFWDGESSSEPELI